MFLLQSHLWPVCAVCRLRVSFCASFESKKPMFFVVSLHQRHVFYGVLEASGPPKGAFLCLKGTLSFSLLPKASASRTARPFRPGRTARPAARILRAFRAAAWLSRKFAKTIIFLGHWFIPGEASSVRQKDTTASLKDAGYYLSLPFWSSVECTDSHFFTAKSP